MDDLHRQPRDGDRAPVRQRIERARAEGRISEADAAIRLTNVGSAQSLTELSLIARDLDQLDVLARADVSPPMAPPSVPAPMPVEAPMPARAGSRALVWVVLGIVTAIVAAGAVALFAFSSIDISGRGTGSESLADPVPGYTGQGEESAGPVVPVPPPPGASFTLDAAGVKGFLADYRKRFGTTKVVDLALYSDYAIVRVPVAGGKRHSGWRYADSRFLEFGPTTANFPGTAVLDVGRLDVPALVRNLTRAQKTLGVEKAKVSHVLVSFRPDFDAAPNVAIYVSNEFSESGYLATTLSGRIVRSYPFSN